MMYYVWDMNVQGFCEFGCATAYCNPLHIGIVVTLIVSIVIYLILNAREEWR